jgi:hypothetical protein
LFGQVSPAIHNENNSQSDYIQGGFFAGDREAIRRYFDNYFQLHDELIVNDQFVGKEQKLMNILVAKRQSAYSCRLYPGSFDTSCISGYDIWFFYQFYFAPLSILALNNNSSSFKFNMTDAECQNAAIQQKVNRKVFIGRNIIDCNLNETLAIPRCFKCI